MTVHIEGMGWFGSVLAHRLARHGVPFTWNDPGATHTAWRASTGLAFPSGDPRSQENLTAWDTWHAEGFLPPGTVTRAAYCFAHKHPPHEGAYTYTDLGWLRVAHPHAYAVDVPAIVRAARTAYARQRRPEPPATGPRVIAHGFGPRLGPVMWGWSAPVRITTPPELDETLNGRTPAFYAREHRFHIVYAYPAPARGIWLAGSALTRQTAPRDGDAQRHLNRWLAAFPACYPHLTAHLAGPPIQGWRPRGHPSDTGQLTTPAPGLLVFPPLWHSGVRWAPTLVNEATTWCQEHT